MLVGFLAKRLDRDSDDRSTGKRGQLQIQETILTVFIFVILIVVAMAVFFRFQENSLKESARDFRLEQFGDKLLTMPDSSELVYTEGGIKKNAVDTLKLSALQSLIQKRKEVYNQRFRYMNITIVQVYPEKIKEKCTTNKIKDCGVWEIYSNLPKEGINTRFRRETPIPLYSSYKGEYTIGLLIIEAYNL